MKPLLHLQSFSPTFFISIYCIPTCSRPSVGQLESVHRVAWQATHKRLIKSDILTSITIFQLLPWRRMVLLWVCLQWRSSIAGCRLPLSPGNSFLLLRWVRGSTVRGGDGAEQVQEEKMGRRVTGHQYAAFPFCVNVDITSQPTPEIVTAGTLRCCFTSKLLTTLSPA